MKNQNKKYIDTVSSNCENRIYVTGRGINVLIHKNSLKEFLDNGYEIGYTKPYINSLKKED